MLLVRMPWYHKHPLLHKCMSVVTGYEQRPWLALQLTGVDAGTGKRLGCIHWPVCMHARSVRACWRVCVRACCGILQHLQIPSSVIHTAFQLEALYAAWTELPPTQNHFLVSSTVQNTGIALVVLWLHVCLIDLSQRSPIKTFVSVF